MRPLLLLTLLLLPACGFKPLHSKEYRAQLPVNLAAVAIEVDTSRRGQLLESEIREGVNPDFTQSEKLYTLRIKLAEREIPLFINPDGTSSRGDIEYNSRYTLTRRVDNAVLHEGIINRVSSFNTSETADYASYVSEEDARTRGITELAQAYKLRLGNLLPGLSGQAPLPASTQPSESPLEQTNLPSRLRALP